MSSLTSWADRSRKLNDRSVREGTSVYWMNRDQRVRDNWALIAAAETAQREHRQMRVVFCVAPTFGGSTERAYDFMIRGLIEVERQLAQRHIPFDVLLGRAPEVLPAYLEQRSVGMLYTDFSPLRLMRTWRETIAQKAACPVIEVDAHNIVPCWVASQKQEYGAYTLRPKLHRLLPRFLTEFPDLPTFSVSHAVTAPCDWEAVRKSLRVDTSVSPITWIEPGEQAAHEQLRRFLKDRIARYDEGRNDPLSHAQSELSPYLHFGHIAPQRAALSVASIQETDPNAAAFFEELVVRRELSDNFCFYNQAYDSVEGFPEWAKKTLAAHAHDVREYLYDRDQFEFARTHDPLWNAAQIEMVQRGKMHGYLRMYWAKKILEWTSDPKTAMAYAIYLNDRYELDGRDPNGYAGIAWSIGGVHDRAWFNRPVYGTIRYMNARGAASKFDIQAYCRLFSVDT